MVNRGLARSRSQAENIIKLGLVEINQLVVTKPNYMVKTADMIKLLTAEHYVSRAALKLASVSGTLQLDFRNKVILDVGSSTGGFTDYALQHGAEKVIAVDVGTNQLHPSLRNNSRIELREQTDIRSITQLGTKIDMVVIDVSFISLRDILPHVVRLIEPMTQVVAMVKPQFEATHHDLKHKGVIKNEKLRRNILKAFEIWIQKLFKIVSKADSGVTGTKGNHERFYVLKKLDK